MPTKKDRVNIILDADALAVLGYSVVEDGPTACGTGPAKRLAKLVERAALAARVAPVGDHDEQRRRRRREQVEQHAHAVVVGPLQVVDEQHYRIASRQV